MPKRDKLDLLRQKVGIMQKDLQAMQKRSNKLSEVPEILKPVNKITNLKSKYSLSQTHKDISFAFRDSEQYFYKEPSQGQAARSIDKMKTERSLSPVLRDISNRIDNNFYTRKASIAEDKENSLIGEDTTKKMYQTSFVGRRYAYNSFGMSRSEIYQEKKKRTFELKKTDTVLNPEKEKETGIKIVKKIDRSPEQMLQENPHSNTKLYFFAEKPVYFSKKGSIGQKNKSSLVNSKSKGQVMPADQSLERTSRSQKKHFTQHIKDLYSPRLSSAC